MARSRKHNKNLAKVQSMLDGTYGSGKTIIGFADGDIHANKKVGERYKTKSFNSKSKITNAHNEWMKAKEFIEKNK